MGIKHLIKGIATYLPGMGRFACRNRGRTDSARYCYSVWLRHLVMVNERGLDTCPKVVAELGPGDSIGAGLAAILTGTEKYYALDVADYTRTRVNLNVFDELVALLEGREPIPGTDEFPEITPPLPTCEFPHQILTDERLAESLAPSRIQEIRDVLLRGTGVSPVNEEIMAGTAMPRATGCEGGIEIRCFAPWSGRNVIKPASVDMIFSQAVLEHVEDLGGAYEALARWLKPGGIMSHQIDFSAHGLAKDWNGHWTWSDLMFKLIRGRRPWLINRQPYSTHRRLLEENGFEIVREVKGFDTSGINRSRLSAAFGDLCDDDLKTRTAYILAGKKP